jgi:NAD(P)-dependent dehydrogenase (short-subunit alcohol dehydrogenase family)
MKNKNWFITGISSGLGKSIAEKAIENGYFVIGTFRNEDQANAFNAENKDKAFAYVLDISNETQIKKVVSDAVSQFKTIDVLVNNAGLGFAGAIEETSTQEVKAIFDANFFGTLQVTQAVLPVMRSQKSGQLFQISSHGGFKAFAGFGIYNASKFALEGFSEALAQEVQPLGINVTIVQPGPFRTNFAGNGFGLAATEIEDYANTSGVFRQKIKGVHGIQEGDPYKAAQAIISVYENQTPPLRLPLGKVALGTIQAKLDSVANDLNNNRAIAESVVF